MSTVTEQNGLDFGIIDDDLSVNIAYLSSKPIAIGSDEMQNPFYVSVDYNLETENGTIGKGYENVLVLCMRDTYNGESDALKILDFVIKTNTFEQIGKYFSLVPANRNILYTQTKTKALIVAKEFLTQFQYTGTLNQNEVIILMLELRENTVRTYSSLFTTKTNAKKFSTLLTLANCYNGNNKQPIRHNLYEFMKNIREASYWINKKNCNFTMSENFLKREFQYKETLGNNIRGLAISKLRQNQDTEIVKIIDKLQTLNESTAEIDYLKNIYRKEEYTDVSNALKGVQNRTFFVTNEQQLEITKEEVTQLFEYATDDKDIYNLFNTFVTSKDLCHLVLNNPYVLNKMKPLFDKYLPFYRYVFGTAWISLYSEECLLKTRSTITNRFVFPIDVASKLPIFPVCSEDLHLNPYISLLVANKLIDSKNNCLSIPTIANYQNYGIGSLTDFKRKFNIFTTGKSDKNILDGIDWTNFAISGSVIPACVPKRSPLYDVVSDPTGSEVEQCMLYFNHYYNESDIDLMCNNSSMFTFLDKVAGVIKCVTENLKQLKGNDAANTINVEPSKTLAVVVHYKYLEQKLADLQEYIGQNWSAEEIIKHIDAPEIKEYFYELYIKIKFSSIKTQRKQYSSAKNALYNDYYRISPIDDMNIYIVDYELSKDTSVNNDSEVCMYMNDITENKVKSTDNIMVLKVAESIKFKVNSSELLHNLEIFRVKENDFFATVARFHLPCVRGYYNGDNLYMLPSCITAQLTGYNIDYKYFAGIRDPIDILNKYRMRGYSIIINDKEKQHMAVYCGSTNKWNGLFPVNIKDKESIKGLFGTRKITDEMFKPLKHFKGFPDDSYRKVDHQYIMTTAELQDWYKTKYPALANCGVNLLDFKTIDSTGYINPIKTWVFDAVQDQIN